MAIEEYSEITRETFFTDVLPKYNPCVFRGVCSNWPVAIAGKASPHEFGKYLMAAGAGRTNEPVEIFFSPQSDGHMHYSSSMKGFNFQKLKVPFAHCLERLLLAQAENPSPLIYMGSTPTDVVWPDFKKENEMILLDSNIKARLWLGSRTLVQPHYDVSDNIAVVVAGRRRFTLFPPEQINNLYVGPIDVTPAGQPMSLVSLNNPDLETFPRYAEALKNALVVELEPGDAIFIPSLWWHGVEGLDSFNALVNYWWNHSSAGADSPSEALIHAILTISSLPEKERRAWRSFFDHYVFQTNGHPLAHLPEEARGVLGSMNPQIYQSIKHYLNSRMKR